MISKLLVFSIFLLVSCTKWYEVKEGNGQLYIADLETEVFDVVEDAWEVGNDKRFTISKGIRFKFKIPKVKKEDSEKLYAKAGVDSWIFRINRISRRGKRPIGHILYNLQRFNSVSKDITGYIYYHSAAAGLEFRRQKCPAFKHRKRITGVEIIEGSEKKYDLFVRKKRAYRSSTIETPSFSPIIFSGDKSLIGSFFIDFALMNSKTKTLYSKWINANGIISIEGEEEISIPECSGVNSERNILNKKAPKAEEFRLK